MITSPSPVLFSAIVGRNGNSPFARSATSLGVSPHHGCRASHHLLLAAASFLCAEGIRNDVVLCGTNEKSKSFDLDFLCSQDGIATLEFSEIFGVAECEIMCYRTL